MIMRWPIMLTLGLVMLLLSLDDAAAANSHSVKQKFGSLEEAATHARDVIRQFKDEIHLKELGFGSTADASNSELGAPFRVYRVGLNRLASYQPNQDPETLLTDTQRTLIPVSVGGEVRSSVSVTKAKNQDGWKISKRGSPNLIRLLQRFRKANTNFVVWIPALGMRFLGDRKDGQLRLTSLEDVPRFGFKAGQELPAVNIFAKLIAEAKATLQDDLPR